VTSTSPFTDIGAVINAIIADIKATQTTQTTRPGAVIYIPPGHYPLLTTMVIDISYLQIKGAGHGFMSIGIRDGSNTSGWRETQPGASHISVVNSNTAAFVVQRAGDPGTNGRLNSIIFRDFCIDGLAFSPDYYVNGKVGISVSSDSGSGHYSDNDSLKIEGMGFVYLEHALVVQSADALTVTDNFITECGNAIELTNAGQACKVTNNSIGAGWIGFSIFAENHQGLLVSGNNIFPVGRSMVHLKNCSECAVSSNKFKSYYSGMITFEGACTENLIASNAFRRETIGGIAAPMVDDLFGLIHLAGDRNAITGNFFSIGLASGEVTPPGSNPTVVLVAAGVDNYLASNYLVSPGVPGKVVLDGSTTGTNVLYSARNSEFLAYGAPGTYTFQPTGG